MSEDIIFGTVSSLNSLKLDEAFWSTISTTQFTPKLRNDEEQLEWNIASLLKQFLCSNLTTGNLGLLVKSLTQLHNQLEKASLTEVGKIANEACNVTHILRTCVRYFSERMPVDALKHQICLVPNTSSSDSLNDFASFEPGIDNILLVHLVKTVATVPLSKATVALHEETISLLLVFLGTKMFNDREAAENCFYQTLNNIDVSLANKLCKRLLENFSNQSSQMLDVGSNTASVAGFASKLVETIYSFSDLEANTPFECPKSLANKSILLLEVLCNHYSLQSEDQALSQNPFKNATSTFINFSLNIAAYQEKSESSFSINFDILYRNICLNLHQEHVTLLFYMLLHRNSSFKNYVLCRTDLDILLLPLLKVLYEPAVASSHQLYMVLIILLILSEDGVFNKIISEIAIPNCVWFKEKLLTDVNLSSLMTLVLIRTIQFNITQMKDKYLHTNCLATMANMSNHFQGLHQYCAQRLVSLAVLLQKKMDKLQKRLSSLGTDIEADAENTLRTELAVIEEILRLLLEIINSALTSRLSQNASLIHSLMYEKQFLEPLRQNHNFQDVVHNIEMVVNFFLGRLDRSTAETDKITTSDYVVNFIIQNSKSFPVTQMQKLPELLFRYCEEEEPEDFFIPYVWSLTYRFSQIYWNLDLISLFKITLT